MGSPTKACVPARQDSFRLPPSSRPQTLNTSNTMAKGSGSKKAKKSGSNVFALFSQRQIQEFKEAFGIMDADKDGLLSSSDIVAAFNSVGKSVSDGEAQGMLSEAPGPVNSHRWLCFSQRRWPEVLMMMTPSSRLSMPSKSTAKSTQICSNTPSCPLVTNLAHPKSTTHSVNSLLRMV